MRGYDRSREVSQERFKTVGLEMAAELEAAGLAPSHRFLEIGCGYGRIAAALAGRVASYDGLDVDAEAVAWCRRAIAPRHPNFRFHHHDVRNPLYNPSGRVDPADHRLPDFGPKDVIALVSVFTHMPPRDVLHYLKELRRICAPDSWVFVSLCLYSPGPRSQDHEAWFPLAFRRGPVEFLLNPQCWAFAFEQGQFLSWCEAAGFRLRSPIRRAAWGRWEVQDWPPQDIVVLSPSWP